MHDIGFVIMWVLGFPLGVWGFRKSIYLFFKDDFENEWSNRQKDYKHVTTRGEILFALVVGLFPIINWIFFVIGILVVLIVETPSWIEKVGDWLSTPVSKEKG